MPKESKTLRELKEQFREKIAEQKATKKTIVKQTINTSAFNTEHLGDQ